MVCCHLQQYPNLFEVTLTGQCNRKNKPMYTFKVHANIDDELLLAAPAVGGGISSASIAPAVGGGSSIGGGEPDFRQVYTQVLAAMAATLGELCQVLAAVRAAVLAGVDQPLAVAARQGLTRKFTAVPFRWAKGSSSH